MAIFRLSREVRDLIYDECAESIHMTLDCALTDPLSEPDPKSWSFCIREIASSETAQGPKLKLQPVGLLSTSQQLRAEMLEYLSANTELHIGHFQLLLHPATELKSLIPSTVRHLLRKISLRTSEPESELGPTQPFDTYCSFTEWLMEAFPRLQTLVINEYGIFYRHSPRENAEEDAEEGIDKLHAAALRSHIWEHRSVIKDLYHNFQSEGLELEMCITYFVEEYNWDSGSTCLEYMLRKPPKNKAEIRLVDHSS